MKSQLPHARVFALGATLLLSVGASAAPKAAPPPPPPPPPMVEAPPTATIDPYEQGAPPASTSTLTELKKPVPSPFHPRLRGMPATTVAAGVYCPNFGSRSLPYGNYCAGQVHLGMDTRMGDVHVSLLLGDVLKVGAIVGFELGTPYMQLGGKRSRVALALRGSFDLVAVRVGKPIPGQADDGLLSFSNTYGPHMSIAISPHASLEIRGAVGWTVGGFWDNQDGFGKPVYAFVAEGWVGVRMGTMKPAILASLLVPALALSGCMHGGHRCHMRGDGISDGGSQGMMGMMNMRNMNAQLMKSWPTIRVDGPAGAHVKMDHGIFGEDLDVRAPFQGQFQPTGSVVLTGYPLEFELDATAAQHYGKKGAATLYGRMLVGATDQKRGVLVLAPSECALKALMDGDIDELRVRAEELPRADLACEAATSVTTPAAAPSCPHAGLAMAHGSPHGGCPHMSGGGAHGPHGGHHGCGAGCSHHQGGGAWLVLRTTKF